MNDASTSLLILSSRSILLATVILLLTLQYATFFEKTSYLKTLTNTSKRAEEGNIISLITLSNTTKEKNVTSSSKSADIKTANKSLSLGHFKDVNITLTNLEIKQLPTNEEIIDLFGEEPLLIGASTQCSDFYRLVPDDSKRWIGVAGLFNTGTNLLYSLLSKNCIMPGDADVGGIQVKWQVPWGKHCYATASRKHTAPGSEKVIKDNGLVVVVTRHPYPWSLSMCKKPYAIKWNYTKANCPNLKYGKLMNWGKHDNLLYFWNDWYLRYFKDFEHPRIIVKSEDLTLRPREITKKLCECGGGKFAGENFTHSIEGVNPNSTTSMTKAWEKIFMFSRDSYGGLSVEDYQVAKQSLDHELIKNFGYVL